MVIQERRWTAFLCPGLYPLEVHAVPTRCLRFYMTITELTAQSRGNLAFRTDHGPKDRV